MRRSFFRYPVWVLVIFFCGLLLFSGCGNSGKGGVQPVEQAGVLLLEIKPAIEIAYDTDGLVMQVTGAEEEGLTGEPCIVVIEALIADLCEAERLDGTDEILMTMEEGSEYHEGFLEGLEEAAEQALADCGLDAVDVKIEEKG